MADMTSGGAGNTLTAFEAAVPQIVIAIPGACSDQIYHGGKVSLLGCGYHLRPRFDVYKDHEDIVEAIQAITSSLADWKAKCAETKVKMSNARSHEKNSPFAIEILQTLIDRVVQLKQSGQWASHGWQDESKLWQPPSDSWEKKAIGVLAKSNTDAGT